MTQPVGRPSKLTPELIEKARGYLATCHATPIETEKGGVSYVDVHLPKVVSLALMLGINKDTVYNWCKDIEGEDNTLRQEFYDIVKEVNAKQEEMLMDKGLGGLFQPKTTGMLLSKHGYSEKIETDITTGGEKITSENQTLANLAIAKFLHGNPTDTTNEQ